MTEQESKTRQVSQAAALGQWALFGGCLLTYLALGKLAFGSETAAAANAERMLSVERALSVDWEHEAVRVADSAPHLSAVVDSLYLWSRWPIIIVGLALAWMRDRPLFYLFRNGLVVSGAIGLPILLVVPVAAPGGLEEGGRDHFLPLSSLFSDGAAAPLSLDLGWVALSCAVLASLAHRAWQRNALATVPVILGAAAVLAGDHYVMGVVAGFTVVHVGLVVAARFPVGPLRSTTTGSQELVGTS